MLASQSPGDPTVAYGPARLQKSYAQLQQNAALQRDSLKVARTVPLKVHHSSQTLQNTCPLLFNLLSEKPSDSESFTTKSSSSEQTNAKMAFNTIAHVSGKIHHKDQQAASLPALNCGQTRTQHLHHSGRTPSTPHQQQVSSPSLSLQPSTDKVLSVGETKPPTNDEIHAIISKKLTYYCNYLTLGKKSGHSNKELGRNSILQLVQSDLLTTSEEGAMIDECCAAVEQYNCLALEEDNSKGNKANAELLPQFNETGDCATSATEKHSTEYPHIMLEVAATCTKNEEEGPVVLTAVPETTWDDRRKLQPTLVLNPSWSQEYKSLLTSNRNLDDIDQVPGVSWALNHMTEEEEKKKGDTTLKPVGTVGLDSAQRMVDVAEDPQTKSNSVVSGNGTFGFSSRINRNAKRKKSIEDQQHAREVAGSAHSQTNSSIAVPENKLQKHARRCESKVKEAPPLYEDISDNDVFQLATELQNTELPTKEHWEFSSPTRFEVPLYEDISEAESRTESMAVETTIPTLVAAPNDMQSTFENGGYGHVQGRAQMKTETLIIAHYCSESELCLKCGCERQTKPSLSCSSSSVLSEEDTADDEMDDDHLVIPISILNLRYEPEDEDQDIPETNVPSPKRCLSPKLAPATAFPPVLVFDTPESFLLSENIIVALGSSSDEHEMDSEGDVETIQKRRGSSDSGDTEDSFDYSSASESNYMTVSKKMLKSLAPVPSKTKDSLSEEESEGNEVTNMQKDQTWAMDKLQKPRQHLQRDDIIIVDSDTEDESDQKCKRRARRKRKRLRLSGDSDDALCSQQKRHLPETFKDKIPKNRPPSLYPPAPLHQSKHDPLFQVVMQDASSDPSKCTEESGQQDENKAASAHVQHKTNIQKISSEQSVIIINSDDEHDQDYEMPRTCSSRLHKVDAPCVRPESVDCEWGPGEDKLHETGPSLADSPLSQHQSKLSDRQFRETTEDKSSDLKRSGQQIEEGGGSEHVPLKAKRQRTSKRRVVVPDSDQLLKKGHFSKRTAVTKEIFSSGSEDSGGGGDNIFASKSRLTVSVDRLCENAKTKPKKNELSSEDLPEEQPLMKDVNSHLLNDFVIPRYVVEFSGPKGGLKLFKEPAVHKQGKDGTLSSEVSTESKRTDSCEKNKAPSYKKVRFFTPVPANDKKQATKNNVQANAQKPARVSRQLSLPEQEGPSTSSSSLSSTSRQLPVQARRSSVIRGVHQSEASSRLPYNPRELSFPPNKLRSCSSSSTLNHPPLKGPASTTQLNATGKAKEHVNSDRPIRGDGRFREDNVRPERRHHDRASGDRAPRKRHNLHKPATILMKRATNDAIQWTKAINRGSSKERRYSVGEGYKWSEKPTVAKSTKGSSWEEKMGRSPPRPYL